MCAQTSKSLQQKQTSLLIPFVQEFLKVTSYSGHCARRRAVPKSLYLDCLESVDLFRLAGRPVDHDHWMLCTQKKQAPNVSRNMGVVGDVFLLQH